MAPRMVASNRAATFLADSSCLPSHTRSPQTFNSSLNPEVPPFVPQPSFEPGAPSVYHVSHPHLVNQGLVAQNLFPFPHVLQVQDNEMTYVVHPPPPQGGPVGNILDPSRTGYAPDPNAPLNFAATVGSYFHNQETMSKIHASQSYQGMLAPAQQFTAGPNRYFAPGPVHDFTAGQPQGFDQNFGPGPAVNNFPTPDQVFGASETQSMNGFPAPSQMFNAAAIQPLVSLPFPGPASRTASAQSFAGMQPQYHYQGPGPGSRTSSAQSFAGMQPQSQFQSHVQGPSSRVGSAQGFGGMQPQYQGQDHIQGPDSRVSSAQGFAGMQPQSRFQNQMQGPGSRVGSAQGFVGMQRQYQGQDHIQGPVAGQMMIPPYQIEPHRVPSRMASVDPRDQTGVASGNDFDNLNNLNPVVARSFTNSRPTTANAHVGPYSFDVNGVPPFVNMIGQSQISSRAVLKIGSIPFNLTIPEVQQFMQKHLIPHYGMDHIQGYPVHINMERSTGKTMDCYIELEEESIVDTCVERFEQLVANCQGPKMGNRCVDVEKISQGDLMKDLFPRAVCIHWDEKTGIPIMIKNMDENSQGFQCLVTHEELRSLHKFAETPSRSPFSGKCLQRIYENMISLLFKFPWASPYYSVYKRDMIVEIYFKILNILHKKMHNTREVGLDIKLLSALVRSGVECKGFAERHKAILLQGWGRKRETQNVSRYCNVWAFGCLTVAPDANDQDVAMWMDLFKSGVDAFFKEGWAPHIKNVIDVAYNPDGFLEVGFLGRDHAWQLHQHLNTAVSEGNIERERELRAEILKADHKNLPLVEVADMEMNLMRMCVEKGWEQWFSSRGMVDDWTPTPFVRTQTEIEAKMDQLGVYEYGIEPPEPKNKYYFPPLAVWLAEDAERKKKAEQEKMALVVKERAASQDITTGMDINFANMAVADPLHGREMSFSSDSGLHGMHQASSRPTSSTGNIRDTMAARDRSDTVIVYRPGGQCVTDIQGGGMSLSSIEKGGRFGPSSTPTRRPSTKSSVGSISPLNTSMMASKSYVAGGFGSESGTPLPPVGTPSRRSLPKSTVDVQQSLDEGPEIGDEIRTAITKARRQENPAE